MNEDQSELDDEGNNGSGEFEVGDQDYNSDEIFNDDIQNGDDDDDAGMGQSGDSSMKG